MNVESTRVALVTGGSRGIGRAVAEALLERRWTAVLASRSEASLNEAVGSLEPEHGERVRGRVADVRDEQAVEELVRWTVEQCGRLDCLVNNAGLGRFGRVDELDGDDWRLVIDTNLTGAFYALKAAARPMIEQGSGWIVNVASLAAAHPFAGGAAYNASKFGLLGLSEAAMLDLRQHGVRVTTILPGSVDTEFRAPDAERDDSWMLRPEDVARAVVDLLRYPDRALPSRIELRPSRPAGKS